MKRENLKNFGFPRWGEYGKEQDAEPVKMCDYRGCSEKGSHPAPKSPHTPQDRWYFCQHHAGEYNRNWDFFAGMSDEDAMKFMKDEAASSSDAFAGSRTFEWGGALDEDGNNKSENAAFDTLELDADATEEAVKKQYRKLAKLYHPDSNPGDPQAAEKFHAIQTAYDILKSRQTGPKK